MTIIREPFTPAPFPLVEVLWYDAKSDDGSWLGWADIPTSQAVRLIGFLITDNEHEVVVSSQWGRNGEEDEFGGVQAVPKGMVVSVRVIEAVVEKETVL